MVRSHKLPQSKQKSAKKTPFCNTLYFEVWLHTNWQRAIDPDFAEMLVAEYDDADRFSRVSLNIYNNSIASICCFLEPYFLFWLLR